MNYKIAWLEGMALSPHHFQQAEKFSDEKLFSLLQYCSPNLMGFSKITFEPVDLASGTINIRECAGVFPDGTYFDSNEVEDLIPSRSALESFDSGKNDLLIYLGMSDYQEGSVNLSNNLHNNPNAPFTSVSKNVVDINSGDNSRNISFARINLKILFEGENLSGYNILPLARIQRNLHGQLEQAPSFVPPAISLSASSSLRDKLTSLIKGLSQKQAFLKSQNLSFVGDNLKNIFILNALNQFIPAINYAIKRESHPEQIFQKLLEFAGTMAIQDMDQDFNTSNYDHFDIAGSYEPLLAYLNSCIEESSETRHEVLPLEKINSVQFSGNLSNTQLASYTEVYLGFDTSTDLNSFLNEATQLLKISSQDKIQHLVMSALPGLKIYFQTEPPAIIRPKINYIYFKLETSGVLWDFVLKGKTISIHAPQIAGVNAVDIIGVI